MVTKRFSLIVSSALVAALLVGCSPDTKPISAPATVEAPTPTVEAPTPTEVAAPVAPDVVAVETPTSNWEYRESMDEMTSKTTKFATITSEESLSLGFPYSGNNYGYLTVRKHPQHGIDVMVRVSKGQMMCQSFQNCTISVRFDDDTPMRWSAIGPEDNSSEMVFLNNEARFIERAKKAKRIMFSIPFYQNGNQVLEFKTPVGLEWEIKAKAKST
jgi:hypothetical protein